MPSNPDPRAERQSLANWLEASRHQVVSEWLKAVRDDPKIPDADHLTLAALQDHFPEMLAELVSALRQPSSQDEADARETGKTHGSLRLRQGYRLDEVLRELARVRELVLLRVRKYCEERGLSELRNEADEQVRRFFDTIVATSARQFMAAQEAEMLLRTRQLQNAYEQVQAATDQLRAVAESRLRLLRGVSHELRNALHALGLRTTALLDESDSERRNSFISDLTGSAIHLQRVLDRLLEFSNILSGETRLQVASVDLDAFMETLGKAHRFAAESKGLTFRCVGSEALPIIRSDQEKLRHIADIVLSNAIQCTEQGSVEVIIRPEEGERWIFQVTDTGVGMDEHTASQVFHEFHRRQQASPSGVGLGLIIARHLARLMDGEITFRSKPGEGTRFEVNLPVNLRAAPA